MTLLPRFLPLILGVGCLTACAEVRAFLVPPPSHGGAATVRAGPKYADVLVHVGRIHGGGADERALALRDGRIIARGTRFQVESLLGPSTQVVRLGRGVAFPGFVDAHVHLDGAALLGDAADLRAATTKAEVATALQNARVVMSDGTDWLWGFGLDRTLAAQLSGSDIDGLLASPAWLSTADGHGAVVNTALIKLLPPAEASEVLALKGRLDGAVAQRAWRALPPVRLQRWKPLLLDVLVRLQRVGVTEVHSMGASAALFAALTALDREGRLPLRCVLYYDGERPEGQALLQPPKKTSNPADKPLSRPWAPSRRVRVAGVKFWLDGTLGARTAALREPYADAPTEKGALRYDDATVEGWIQAADAAQFQLALHAIGDAAVDQVARALAKLNRPAGALPVRLEHAQVVAPETLLLLQGKAVVCSVQPLHAGDDAPFAAARLGASRLDWAYGAAELATVCPILAGSDLPISRADPMAMWRHLRTAFAQVAPGSAATLALRALLPGGTAATGPLLEVGTAADLVVWSRDPLEELPAGTPPAVPLAMVVAGEPTVLDVSERE